MIKIKNSLKRIAQYILILLISLCLFSCKTYDVDPDNLIYDQNMEAMFIDSFCELMNERDGEGVWTSEVCSIRSYYGKYDDSYAVMIGSQAAMTDAVEFIDGICFFYKDGNRITIYNNGNMYNLEDAYNQKYISREDLKEISYIQNDNRIVYEWVYKLFS